MRAVKDLSFKEMRELIQRNTTAREMAYDYAMECATDYVGEYLADYPFDYSIGYTRGDYVEIPITDNSADKLEDWLDKVQRTFELFQPEDVRLIRESAAVLRAYMADDYNGTPSYEDALEAKYRAKQAILARCHAEYDWDDDCLADVAEYALEEYLECEVTDDYVIIEHIPAHTREIR